MTRGVVDVNPDGCTRDEMGEAARFIRALAGDDQARVTFQTFDDAGGDGAPRVFHGTLMGCWSDLWEAQDNGQGVFIMVAEGDGKGRRASNVTGLRALFIDDDVGTVKASMFGKMPPNVTVHSGRGWHYYWLLRSGEALEDFGPAQRALAARFGTDPAVCDLPRVMRLPGTRHFKDRSNPQDVVLVHCANLPRRSIQEVLDGVGAKVVTSDFGGSEGGGSQVSAQQGSRRLDAFGPGRPKTRARSYIKTIRAVEGEGGDLATYKVACALLHGFALPYNDAWTLLCEWNLSNASPPWDSRELGLKLEHARKYGKGTAVPDREPDTIGELAARDSSLDPSSYCFDTSRAAAPWRPWRGGAWQDGMASSALDRLLKNSGLDRHARDAWKRAVPVVVSSEAIYSSPDKLVATDIGLVANTYRPPTLRAEAGDCTPALEVIANLANHDDEVERYILGWLAKMVQGVYAGSPARIGTALVLFGAKGSGKGVLEAMVTAMLGADNVASIGQAELNSQFNSWLDGKLCVFADEVFSSDQRAASLSAKVKNYITAHTISIDTKGIPQKQVSCRANWILAGNSNRTVEVEAGDRRYSVIRTGPPIPVELGARVADDARAGGPIIRAFLHYLRSIPAANLAADYRPLHTAAKDEVQRASGNSATRFALEVGERGFYSLTSAWVHQGGREADLFLRGDDGLRCLEGTKGPLILRRTLMSVFRAYAQEVGAPATSEGTLLAALKEVMPEVRDATVDVAGKLERVVAGLPGAVAANATFGKPESTAKQTALF